MYLADLGAEVVKIERPRGDDARHWGPPFVGGESAWFASANRGKRSVVLDLRHPNGREVLDRLLQAADVAIVSLNPAKLDALGLAPQQVRSRHPHLVLCAVSGFGLTGPDRARPGYDLIAQARSGLMSVTGEADRAPQRVSTALSDIAAALVATTGVVSALLARARHGQGDVVDAALLDTDLALMAPRIAAYLAGDPEPAPSSGSDSVLAVYQQFPTADRPIVVAVGSDAIWRRLCACLGLDDLARDPELRDNSGRRRHRGRVVAAIERALRSDTADAWCHRLHEAGVPVSKVATLADVVADPQVRARRAIVSLTSAAAPAAGVDDPTGPSLAGVASPWRLGSQPAEVPGSVPGLGDDTRAFLKEHGMTDGQVDGLVATGVVWESPRGGRA